MYVNIRKVTVIVTAQARRSSSWRSRNVDSQLDGFSLQNVTVSGNSRRWPVRPTQPQHQEVCDVDLRYRSLCHIQQKFQVCHRVRLGQTTQIRFLSHLPSCDSFPTNDLFRSLYADYQNSEDLAQIGKQAFPGPSIPDRINFQSPYLQQEGTHTPDTDIKLSVTAKPAKHFLFGVFVTAVRNGKLLAGMTRMDVLGEPLWSCNQAAFPLAVSNVLFIMIKIDCKLK